MNTIIVPINTSSSEPEKCPSCGKKEHKVTKCGHCDYTYQRRKSTFKEEFNAFITVVLGIAFIMYSLVTLMAWAMQLDSTYNEPKTLVEFIASQGDWIVNTLKMIY